MPSKVDNRHKKIGSRHRAASRYAMLLHRTQNPTGKNACYAGVEVRISREDFIEWFMANDFPGCSVDRIRSEEHYEVGNLQMLTLAENIAKDKAKAQNGSCECYACKTIKPLEEFVKSSRRLNGYSTICKECERTRNRGRTHARKDKSALTGELA